MNITFGKNKEQKIKTKLLNLKLLLAGRSKDSHRSKLVHHTWKQDIQPLTRKMPQECSRKMGGTNHPKTSLTRLQGL